MERKVAVTTIAAGEWLTPKGRKRREQLLRAALVVVGRDGYAGATQRAIATEAGVPPASTHYFFDSVDHLISEAAKFYLWERVAVYNRAIDHFTVEGLSQEQAIRNAARLVGSVSIQSRSAQFEIYLNARRHPEIAPAVDAAISEIESIIVRLLGSLGVPNPERWAGPALAMIDGYAIRAVAGGPAAVTDLEDALVALVETADTRHRASWAPPIGAASDVTPL